MHLLKQGLVGSWLGIARKCLGIPLTEKWPKSYDCNPHKQESPYPGEIPPKSQNFQKVFPGLPALGVKKVLKESLNIDFDIFLIFFCLWLFRHFFDTQSAEAREDLF